MSAKGRNSIIWAMVLSINADIRIAGMSKRGNVGLKRARESIRLYSRCHKSRGENQHGGAVRIDTEGQDSGSRSDVFRSVRYGENGPSVWVDKTLLWFVLYDYRMTSKDSETAKWPVVTVTV